MTQALLAELRPLEEALYANDVRQSSAALEDLLHPRFEEVGRSGRKYSRATIIDELLHGEVLPSVELSDYSVSLLAEDVALLTYHSAHLDHAGRPIRQSRRSSLWLKDNGRWQIRFHQGTPAEGSV